MICHLTVCETEVEFMEFEEDPMLEADLLEEMIGFALTTSQASTVNLFYPKYSDAGETIETLKILSNREDLSDPEAASDVYIHFALKPSTLFFHISRPVQLSTSDLNLIGQVRRGMTEPGLKTLDFPAEAGFLGIREQLMVTFQGHPFLATIPSSPLRRAICLEGRRRSISDDQLSLENSSSTMGSSESEWSGPQLKIVDFSSGRSFFSDSGDV